MTQVDVANLQARARRARDQSSREKHQLLARAWGAQQGDSLDKMLQKISLAREQLQSSTVAAADQGKDEVTLLRMSFQPVDLRHLLQEELHASQQRTPDPYPKLRSLGPPSFRHIEGWLQQDLKVKEWQQCPLPWLVELESWIPKHAKASWFTRWALGRPKLPEALTQLFQECKDRKLQPRFEPYQHREDRGIALVVRWKP